MAKPAKTAKIIVATLVTLALLIALLGYFNQAETLNSISETDADDAKAETTLSPTAPIFEVTADDLVIGKADAPVTLLEYASLSCSHCAHFHEDVLPDLQKKYIDQGKLKVVFRHFPLNAPALRASQMVACMPKSQQHALLSDLFKQQNDWAFSENFLSEIKLIAGKHQVDSAAFDSCMKDTAIENKIIQSRQKADALGMVSGTPTFYINGVKYEEVQRVSGFSKAIDAALNAAAKTVK